MSSCWCTLHTLCRGLLVDEASSWRHISCGPTVVHKFLLDVQWRAGSVWHQTAPLRVPQPHLHVLQVESTIAMQQIAPQVKQIQEKFKGRDQQEMQLKVAELYKKAGVNPLAGCLPTLATLPVWIGLYR